MLKRGQEQNFGEVSVMANNAQAKARPRNLVCQVSQGPGRRSERTALKNPENPGKLTNVPGIDRSSWKPERDCDTSDNFKHSRVRKQENVQSTENWKQANGSIQRVRLTQDRIVVV